mgnify:FL=1
MVRDSSVRIAQDGAAWKAPMMSGYLKKTMLDAETHGKGAYKITFVKKDGSEFDFFFDNGTGISANNLILDKDLLENLLVADWASGKAADFEAARINPTEW